MTAVLPMLLVAGALYAPPAAPVEKDSMRHTGHLRDFQVFELRRYTVKPEERGHFARYFESYFPEAFEQLGSLVHGHFLERGKPSGFTWIRGFHDIEARATVSEAFYGGPLWKEHSATMNDRLIDHTNVLLLRPLRPERAITVLPAVDAVREGTGARGVVVAQVFALRGGSVDAFAKQAEATFASYRAAGAREAGVLVTLDVPNNFPRLPFRTDGPYLVWLGILKDDEALETRFKPLLEESHRSLSATGLLRGDPELLVLDPASRSRLRWFAEAPAPRAEASSAMCATPAHRQFDFWAGDWDGYDVGAEDKLAARVRVDVVLDGCALYEVYEGTNGLVGQSLSVYDAARQVWHQTWVTNRGQLLMVDGRLESDTLAFEGTNPGADGRPVMILVAFKPESGGVHQTARTSTDGGKTWEPLFDMVFRPHKR